MARDPAVVLEELLQSKKRIADLTGQLAAENSRFRALSAEFACRSFTGTQKQRRRTPEANMMDSVPGIVHRCRAAKITAEQARQVAILQLSTLAREKYDLTTVPEVVRDRVNSEVARTWA
jgi:hypothetical protein